MVVIKMNKYIISTGTITYAIKGRDLLRQKGFTAHIERRTTGLSSMGCGYNIILKGNLDAARSLLVDAGIKILNIDTV